jgi:hypothetical protein
MCTVDLKRFLKKIQQNIGACACFVNVQCRPFLLCFLAYFDLHNLTLDKQTTSHTQVNRIHLGVSAAS